MFYYFFNYAFYTYDSLVQIETSLKTMKTLTVMTLLSTMALSNVAGNTNIGEMIVAAPVVAISNIIDVGNDMVYSMVFSAACGYTGSPCVLVNKLVVAG